MLPIRLCNRRFPTNPSMSRRNANMPAGALPMMESAGYCNSVKDGNSISPIPADTAFEFERAVCRHSQGERRDFLFGTRITKDRSLIGRLTLPKMFLKHLNSKASSQLETTKFAITLERRSMRSPTMVGRTAGPGVGDSGNGRPAGSGPGRPGS